MKNICWGGAAGMMLLLINAWAGEPTRKVGVELLAVEVPARVIAGFVVPVEKAQKPAGNKGNMMQPKSCDEIDTEKLIKSIDSLVAENKVTIMARERMSCPEGQKSSINTDRDILYMEQIGDDTFKLKKSAVKAGISLEATPTLLPDGKIKVDFSLIINRIERRIPIEGAEGLEIGSPILSSKRSKLCVILEKRQSRKVSTFFINPTGSMSLIILTAREES